MRNKFEMNTNLMLWITNKNKIEYMQLDNVDNHIT